MMKTNRKTTYILLEKGIEDIELLNELTKLLLNGGISATIEIIQKYPKLNEFRQELEKEVYGDSSC